MTEDEVYNQIIKIIYSANQNITKNSVLLNHNVESVLASLPYLETDEQKISSIVRSIIKNHYFQDGNKRTAYTVLLSLCIMFNISINKSNLEYKILEIAENSYDIDKITNLLFNIVEHHIKSFKEYINESATNKYWVDFEKNGKIIRKYIDAYFDDSAKRGANIIVKSMTEIDDYEVKLYRHFMNKGSIVSTGKIVPTNKKDEYGQTVHSYKIIWNKK